MTSERFITPQELFLEALQKRWTVAQTDPGCRDRILQFLSKRSDILHDNPTLKENFLYWREQLDFTHINENSVLKFKSLLKQTDTDQL